jgi:hypothetical protein
LAGFFGGNPRAFTIDFDIDLGNKLNIQLPLIEHFSGAFMSLLEQPESDFTPNEHIQTLLNSLLENTPHAIAWLVEIFNPQRYPARDFMRYAWVDQARSRNPAVNPVQYSSTWTRSMADRFAQQLPEVLDKFAEFFFEQDFLTWLDLPQINREEIIETWLEKLEPYMLLLRILLVEDDFEFLGGLAGFSGYDGYRHGVIPILEAFGVPQRDILTYDEFLEASDSDEALVRLILEPLLDVLERVLADPIFELPRVLPNLIYFMTAEENGAQNNFVSAINRMLRPLYAAVDMLTPMAEIDDIMALFGLEYPIILTLGGVTQELRFPACVSLNAVVSGFAREWFSDLTDRIGLSLELEDFMDLITGRLSVFRSVNGQNDAVRLETDLPDLLTNAARLLIPMLLSDENWGEMRLFLAAQLPANTRDTVLHLLDGLANLLRDTDERDGPDIVLAVVFYLFTGANCVLDGLLALRQFRGQLTVFFEHISQNIHWYALAAVALGGLAIALSPPVFVGLLGGLIGLIAGVFAAIVGVLAGLLAVPALAAAAIIFPPVLIWLIWRALR